MMVQRTGRLSMKCCPKEVVDWGHECTSIPIITDVPKFQGKWIDWWSSCQPKWRPVEAWLFPLDEGKDKDWERLNVTGPHGLFTIVMSTSWWAASASLDSQRASFDAAVADLHWVIKNLICINSQSRVTQSEAVPAPKNKFPGHSERESGKRQIKPSFKAIHCA